VTAAFSNDSLSFFFIIIIIKEKNPLFFFLFLLGPKKWRIFYSIGYFVCHDMKYIYILGNKDACLFVCYVLM
jgi:hypothetical protein